MAIMYKDGDKMSKIAKVMYLDTATNTIKTMTSCKGLVDGVVREFLPQKKVVIGKYGTKWSNTYYEKTERLGDAVGLQANIFSAGTNDFDNTPIWGKMRRCNLSDSGIVNAYYGDANYRTDGSNGQCMVEIPKFWYKVIYITTSQVEFWISNVPTEGYKLHPAFYRDRNGDGVVEEVDYRYHHTYIPTLENGKLVSKSGVRPKTDITIGTARNYAKANGNGWGLVDFNLRYAIQLLYLIEYTDIDSQSAVGRGYSNNVAPHITGGTDSLGNYSGNEGNLGTDGKHQVSYRGIEDFWGNYLQFIDGFYCDSSVNVWIGNRGFNNTGAGYTKYTTGLSTNIGGYITGLFMDDNMGFIPKIVDSNYLNGFPDFASLVKNCIPVAGGAWSYNYDNGAFSFYCTVSSTGASEIYAGSLAY